MEIEKSRNGYYTVTFINKDNLSEAEIHEKFSTVGNICKIILNHHRIFIRFRDKEEAEKAILKFGEVLDVKMANNSDYQREGNRIYSHKPANNRNCGSSSPESLTESVSMDKLKSDSVFHLILGNLPKNYTVQDVKSLTEEVNPICINQVEETRAFKVKFCHIVLDSSKHLTYLISKLNGFTISGEKLIAAEVKNLLEWRKTPLLERKDIQKMINNRDKK